jgi:hypothetical protein
MSIILALELNPSSKTSQHMFASICQIREDGGRKFKNIKEEEHNVNNDNQSEDSIEASAHDVFNDPVF